MKKDSQLEDVVFRTIEGEVNAFLPCVPANRGMVMCYAHVGQHSEASLGYYRKGRPSTIQEYDPLLRELRERGYVLEVKARLNYNKLRKGWDL
jgi:hypothetical protein